MRSLDHGIRTFCGYFGTHPQMCRAINAAHASRSRGSFLLVRRLIAPHEQDLTARADRHVENSSTSGERQRERCRERMPESGCGERMPESGCGERMRERMRERMQAARATS